VSSDPKRRAEIGDDWAADALAENQIANHEEWLKEGLREARRQIVSLEQQVRERDGMIAELQAMIRRAASEPLDVVIASMQESIKVAQTAKRLGMDLGMALKFVRALRAA